MPSVFDALPERGYWSGQQDLNLRPGVPKTPALPGCAIPRQGARASPMQMP